MLRAVVPRARVLRGISQRKYAVSAALGDRPMTEPLPGTGHIDYSAVEKLPAPQAKVSRLSNGLRVASVENYGQITTLSLYVDAGSRYETPANNGVSHFLEQLAFKSMADRTAFRTVREVEHLGGALLGSASREQIVYSAEFLRSKLPYFVELLSAQAKNRHFKAQELKAARGALAAAHQQLASTNIQTLVLDGAHAEAYRRTGLGLPTICPEHNLEKISADDLASFCETFFQPTRMVLAAAGVEHEELVEMAEMAFGTMSSAGAPVTRAPSKYFGGESRVQLASPLTHVALAFEGISHHDKDLAASVVLHMMMGGGNSFSAGGPGKGMYTRLYQGVLNKHAWVQSATAFNVMYADSGLFGVVGSAESDRAKELSEVLADAMKAMASVAPTQQEAARAKAQTKTSLLMNLESRSILADDVGRQLLIYGKRFTPEELCAQIDAVSPADLQRVAQRFLKSNPTISVVGDAQAVPSAADLKLK
eukprot:tig00000144_g8999.t1